MVATDWADSGGVNPVHRAGGLTERLCIFTAGNRKQNCSQSPELRIALRQIAPAIAFIYPRGTNHFIC